ncbi:hypothetical protein [Chamaesiphon sp.]|uniref:hypothetical protein n=1 Tax=Chamaesiphon sp. TaxID=2814140 RepID=UPI0035935AC8
MSDESQRNSIFNVVTDSNVYHAQLDDLNLYAPDKLSHLQRGGIRNGVGRNEAQTQQMLDKIPPSDRSGVDAQSATEKVREYLAEKDASHIEPHSKGGSGHPDNIKWEDRSANRARGDREMTPQEQIKLDVKAQVDNFAGALKAGLEAAPKGAAIGAVTTAPFSMLRNALRVVRGEISAQEAVEQTLKETAIGGGVGGVTALTVTTVATACLPVKIALTAINPALLIAGGAGMIYEFFKILDNHKQKTKEYYENVTQQELNHLKKIEDELIYEHTKNMEFLAGERAKNLEFLAESRSLNDKIANRPMELGVEGALKRYLESAAIAQSLGGNPVGANLLNSSQKFISSVDH